MELFTKQTYCEQVVEYIKQAILCGELAPGDPVKEVVLAESLGISRAPVREALQVLIQGGLITSEPQKGKYIRVLTSREIRETYIVGGILEGAGVAMSLSLWLDADFQALDVLTQEIEAQAAQTEGLAALAYVDNTFHALTLARCSNKFLVEQGRSCCTNIAKFLFYNHWDTLFTQEEFCDRHLLIAEAIQSRKGAWVEDIIREHYRETGLRMAYFGA